MVLREDCVAELNNYIDPLYRFVGSHVFKQENLDGKLLTCILEVDGFTQPSVSGARPQVVPTNLHCRWFKFGTMHAGTVTYNITQYSGVRKLETVTVAEVNAYVLNSPLRRFTDPKGSMLPEEKLDALTNSYEFLIEQDLRCSNWLRDRPAASFFSGPLMAIS
ncbi:hypothetical protein F2Q70_00043473 [Brassica cretica]|uniref:Uncharacterized protein n=1 Tax=Brassica cretica TaxID=69181 RepID=A0A8S9KJG7_BRACR|nr:hypothetical protein F2Q70_00043473 [Brassica cretica]